MDSEHTCTDNIFMMMGSRGQASKYACKNTTHTDDTESTQAQADTGLIVRLHGAMEVMMHISMTACNNALPKHSRHHMYHRLMEQTQYELQIVFTSTACTSLAL